MRKLAMIAAVVIGVTAAQDSVIRGGVALVDLLVTVRDKKGALAKNLQQSDFKIYEDGREQQIQRFARETDLPLTVGVLVDVSGSVASEIADERKAAKQFFTQVLRPEDDQAFVISFARDATLMQDLTNSIQKLSDGLDELAPDRAAIDPGRVVMAQFPFPMPGGTGRGGPRRLPGGTPPISRRSTRVFGGTVMYDAVFLAADEVLRPATGRKAIILITDGEDQGSRVTLTRALEASLKSDVIIYSIFVKPDRSGSGGEETLQRLSDETGGRVFRLQRNLDKIFSEISDELRSQYSISYVPSRVGINGDYRRVEVRMVNKTLKAQYRQGYYAKDTE